MRQIAISDLHGQFKTFKAGLELIDLKKEDELYILGDIIGHGSNPRKTTENPLGIINEIISLRAQGYTIHCIRGNHDHRLILEHQNRKRLLKEPYLSFLENMPFYIELDQYLLVHAGFNLSQDNPFEDKHAMLNRFDFELDEPHPLLINKRVIHGHVVQPKSTILKRANNKAWSMSIDNGVFLKGEGKGDLCVLDLTNWTVDFQSNVD